MQCALACTDAICANSQAYFRFGDLDKVQAVVLGRSADLGLLCIVREIPQFQF